MSLASRLDQVRSQIAAAATRAGRPPSSVRLVAVGKTQPATLLREAALAGQRAFGENYVQELRAKQGELADLDLEWHFIGRLQRNKAKDVVGRAALVHAVDSLELGDVLGRRAAQAGVIQDVLVEVNLGDERSKAGVTLAFAPALVTSLSAIAGLRCVGLMTLPPPATQPEDNRVHFRALATCARALGLAELSMGMSDDFEVAVEEGATLVRVGTAIFGARAPR